MAEQGGASEQTAQQSRDFLANISTQMMLQNSEYVGSSKEQREAQSAIREQGMEQLRAIAIQSGLIKDQTKSIEEGDDKLIGEAEKSNDWMSKAADFADRQAKAALRQASKVKDFGKRQTDMLKAAATGMLDLLLTGLGLVALWKLFEWLSEQDWEKIAADVKKWVDDMVVKWDDVKQTVEDIGGFLLRMTGIFWVMTLFERWKSVFGIGGAAYQLWVWMIKNPISALFGEDSAVRKIIRLIRKAFGAAGMLATAAGKVLLGKERFDKIFGPDGRLRTMLRNIRSMFGWMLFGVADDVGMRKGMWTTWFGKDGRIRTMLRQIAAMFGWMLSGPADDLGQRRGMWTTWFGPDGRLRKMLRWIKTLFGGATIVEAVDDVDAKRGLISKWFGADSPIRKMLRWIKTIFGGSIRFLLNFATGGAFGLLFGEEGALRKLLNWVSGFFGTGGKKGGGIKAAFDAISKSEKLAKIATFLKGIGAKFLKFLGPISWLIAGYQAIAGEGGFMETFEKTEGSLWDKTVAGLSAGIKKLVDFFVFDTVQLIEDFVKWSIKKLAGLFGIKEEDVENSDWYKFSITGFLKDFFGDIMLYLEGLYTLDPKKMAEGIKGMWGKFKGLVDWFYGTLVTPLIQWAAKNLFGFSDEEADAIEFKPMQWLEDNFLAPLFNWLEGLFSMDFEAMAKSIMPDWLYSLFSEEGSEKAKKELRSLGLMTDNLVQDDTMNLDQIGQMLESKEGRDQKNLVGQLSTLISDESIEERDRSKLKALLNEYGAGLNRGGYVPPGMTVPAVLHGPEVVKPLKEIPAQERPTGGGAGTMMVNAPSSSVVNAGSSTTVVGSVSPVNPNKKALGY